MAGPGEADLEGDNKGARPRHHLRHLAVRGDRQGSHARAGLGEEGAAAEDQEPAAGPRGEAEDCDGPLSGPN